MISTLGRNDREQPRAHQHWDRASEILDRIRRQQLEITKESFVNVVKAGVVTVVELSIQNHGSVSLRVNSIREQVRLGVDLSLLGHQPLVLTVLHEFVKPQAA